MSTSSRSLALALALGLGLWVSRSEAQQVVDAFPAGLSAPTRDALRRLADSAQAAGLPAQVIVAKAAEGMLKGADEARIIRAARSLLVELMIARDVLPHGASLGMLTAAASAVHAGVSPQTVSRLIRSGESVRAGEVDLSISLIALTDLVASKVPAESAANAVEQLLRRRAPEAELTAFRAAVAHDIASGESPQAALDSRTKALVRTLDSRADLMGRRP